MALISFPVMLKIDFLLGLWLKEVPEGASIFCRLIILGNLLGCLGEGIPNLINACGKIKAYQVVVHTVLISGLPISFMLYKMGYNPYTISVVYCAINFLNSFVKLFMLRRVVEFDVWSFMKISHMRIFAMSVPLIVFYMFYPQTSSMSAHIVGLMVSFLFFVVVLSCFGLDSGERTKIINFLKAHVVKR